MVLANPTGTVPPGSFTVPRAGTKVAPFPLLMWEVVFHCLCLFFSWTFAPT